MDFESRVWDCDGGDSEEVRGLHLGNRQGNSKKGGGGLKVLIFHYVPQSTGALAGRSPYPTVQVTTEMNRQFLGQNFHPLASCILVAQLYIGV